MYWRSSRVPYGQIRSPCDVHVDESFEKYKGIWEKRERRFESKSEFEKKKKKVYIGKLKGKEGNLVEKKREKRAKSISWREHGPSNRHSPMERIKKKISQLVNHFMTFWMYPEIDIGESEFNWSRHKFVEASGQVWIPKCALLRSIWSGLNPRSARYWEASGRVWIPEVRIVEKHLVGFESPKYALLRSIWSDLNPRSAHYWGLIGSGKPKEYGYVSSRDLRQKGSGLAFSSLLSKFQVKKARDLHQTYNEWLIRPGKP